VCLSTRTLALDESRVDGVFMKRQENLMFVVYGRALEHIAARICEMYMYVNKCVCVCECKCVRVYGYKGKRAHTGTHLLVQTDWFTY